MKNLSKVEFLQTSAGSYGIAHSGDKLVINSRVAEELEKKGVLKISGVAPESAEESVPSKGSVRFTDETKEKSEKVVVTEKVSKAGPNAPKKK